MEHINTAKVSVLSIMGAVGAFISSLFGGWDGALTTLAIFMAIDYITGIIVAGVFHKSKKSKNGALESRAGWKGLCRKGTTLLIVLVAVRLDLTLGSNYIKDGVTIAYILNELISISENAGLMGVPIVKPLRNAIDIFRNKPESEGDKNADKQNQAV